MLREEFFITTIKQVDLGEEEIGIVLFVHLPVLVAHIATSAKSKIAHYKPTT